MFWFDDGVKQPRLITEKESSNITNARWELGPLFPRFVSKMGPLFPRKLSTPHFPKFGEDLIKKKLAHGPILQFSLKKNEILRDSIDSTK